jgi:hypothetical protein
MRLIDFDGQPSFHGHPNRRRLLVETPDYIFINGKGHTKDTLSPVFGMNTPIYTDMAYLSTDNHIGTFYDFSNYTSRSKTNGWYYHRLNNTYGGKNNMQADLCGIHASETWQSIYEPDYYYHSAAGASDTSWMYKVDRKTGQIVQRKSWSGAYYDNSHVFFAETEDYLYTLGFPNATNESPRIMRVRKTDFDLYTLGTYGAYTGNQLLAVTTKYVTTLKCWPNASSSVGFVVTKNAFTDSESYSTSSYYRVRGSGWKYERLQKYIKQESGNDYELHDSVVNSANSTNSMLSDRELYDPKVNFHIHSGAGLVHDYTNGDDSLRKTHDIGRWYVAYMNVNDTFEILRFNTSISDDEDAPGFDVRKCVVSNPEDLEFPTHVNIAGSTNALFSGSATTVNQSCFTSYFSSDDCTKHYLLLSFENAFAYGISNNTVGYEKMYVYQIVNHNDSITNDIHETSSLDLKLIQVIHESGSSFGLLRPNKNPKTFVYYKERRTDHPIYNWNQAIEKFEKVGALEGEAVGAAADSEGRIYTLEYVYPHTLTMDLHTLKIPSRLVITPAQEVYEFSGSEIASTVSLEAYNHLGERVATKVNLELIGEGIVFVTAGGVQVTQIQGTTNTNSPTILDIKIKQGSIVRINASVSAGSTSAAATFSLSNKTKEVLVDTSTTSITESSEETSSGFSNPPYKVFHNGYEFFLVSHTQDYIKYQGLDADDFIHTIFFENDEMGTLKSVSDDNNTIFFVGVSDLKIMIDNGNCEYLDSQ